MFVCLLDELILGFFYSDLTLETGGFELALTINLVLQANRLTESASHCEHALIIYKLKRLPEQLFFRIFTLITSRSSRSKEFCKNVFLKTFDKFYRKVPVAESLCNKVSDVSPITLLK